LEKSSRNLSATKGDVFGGVRGFHFELRTCLEEVAFKIMTLENLPIKSKIFGHVP
jgi:hypothetical protein